MKKSLLVLILSTFSYLTYSQCGSPGWICMQNGTFLACDGTTISDNGGGSAYTDGQYTMTICPSTPGDVIQLDFSAFSLQNPPGGNSDDVLSIFDGDNASAPSLGDYTGTSLQGLQVTATVNNTSGCLTLVFNDLGAANTTSPGFEAAVTCTTPCDPPTAASTITDPTPVDPAIQSVGICANTPVSFSGLGSFAATGFTLSQYIWAFDDGTVDNTSGQNVTHTFSEPGEYVVTLTVEDNNGCQSLNIIPLQVLVSTTPQFPGIVSQSTCFAEEVILEAVLPLNSGGNLGGAFDVYSPTWTALPPQVVAGQTYLADGAGFSYSSCLEFDFFEDGATIESCDQILNILVNMEHSYMGDLGVFITCPNGTSVSLVEWGINGGGGTFLGEAVDDESTTPGVGYDYFWTPLATNGTWGENAGGFGTSLPSGTYESYEDLCNLVGCPLNGAWCINITDNLGADNGYIFEWGLGFDPALYPDVTTFTPIIGQGADSSYWSGPNITTLSQNGDIATINPSAPGVYDYTYTVINNFGCQFDTTITVEWTQPLSITAGPDQVFSCNDVVLQGGFADIPTPSCGADAGVFSYCYPDNDAFTWTFCPDNPGDGFSNMTFTFISGQMENFWETFTVYNGDNTSAPILATWSTGDATGQSWTATNPTGCLTITFDSDGSISCGGGWYTEWIYEVSCSNGGPEYTWEWSPAGLVDDPSSPTPTVTSIPNTTTFTLSGYPVDHPQCAQTDDVVVSIDPLGDPGLPNTITICSTDAPFDMLTMLLGNPVTTGTWYSPTNVALPDGTFDPGTDLPGTYTYEVSLNGCTASATLTIQMALPTQITIPDDTTICEFNSINFDVLTLQFGQPQFSYSWSYDGANIASTEFGTYTPLASGQICVDVTDACGYVANDCFNVEVLPAVDVQFEADTTALCWPDGFVLNSLIDPTLYTNLTWELSDGQSLDNSPTYNVNFSSPGVYDVSLTVINSLGCIFSSTQEGYLTSYSPPSAGYTPDPQPAFAYATEIFFEDQSAGDIMLYSWEFGSPVIGTSSLPSPIFEFPVGVGGEYPVHLEVTDVNGCFDYIDGVIIINELFNVYAPNTFTPNGDGINDYFVMKGSDIDPTRFSLKIFDRWGEVVFSSTNPDQPWTGDSMGSGYFVQDGWYNWIAVVTSESTGEKLELKGMISVMR